MLKSDFHEDPELSDALVAPNPGAAPETVTVTFWRIPSFSIKGSVSEQFLVKPGMSSKIIIMNKCIIIKQTGNMSYESLMVSAH